MWVVTASGSLMPRESWRPILKRQGKVSNTGQIINVAVILDFHEFCYWKFCFGSTKTLLLICQIRKPLFNMSITYLPKKNMSITLKPTSPWIQVSFQSLKRFIPQRMHVNMVLNDIYKFQADRSCTWTSFISSRHMWTYIMCLIIQIYKVYPQFCTGVLIKIYYLVNW